MGGGFYHVCGTVVDVTSGNCAIVFSRPGLIDPPTILSVPSVGGASALMFELAAP
jgi:hypothetical protein